MHFIALFLAFLTTAPATAGAVVARTSTAQLRADALTCNPDAQPAASCRQFQQTRFTAWILDQVLPSALKAAGATVTKADEDEAMRRFAPHDETLDALVASRQQLAHAILLVRRGQAPEAVYDQELSDAALARKGVRDVRIPRSAFEAQLRHVTTAAEAERLLSRATRDEVALELRRMAYREAAAKKINAYISERAASEHKPVEEIRDHFWRSVYATEHVEVLSEDYKLPFLIRSAR